MTARAETEQTREGAVITTVSGFVGMRIRQARDEAGWSQGHLGTLLVPARTYAAVSDMERGKTAITVDVLMCVAALFDKHPTWFLPLGEGGSFRVGRGDTT